MPKLSEIKEKRFGKLLVIEFLGFDKNRHSKWRCKCDCDNEKVVLATNLLKGKTTSCGCFYKKKRREICTRIATTHGLSKHPLFRTWGGIKKRCLNTKAINYKDYGGRGISLCDEWSSNFEIFYNWAINNGWKKGLQIDRKDNDKGYFPENCRFVTPKENANNRRNSKRKN